MAIGTGITVTRELSSITQAGAATAIAKAFSVDEPFGFDSDGLRLVNDIDGTHQQSTVSVNWEESVSESQQEFYVSTGVSAGVLGFTGVPTLTKKVQKVVVADFERTYASGFKKVEFTLGSRTFSQTLSTGPLSVGAASITNILFNTLRNQPEVESVTKDDFNILTIHYTADAGNISVGPSVEFTFNSSIEHTFSLGRSDTVPFSKNTEGTTVTVEITADTAVPGVNRMEFPSLSRSVVIPAGESVTYNTLGNLQIGLLRSSPAFESRKGANPGGTLSSGYLVKLKSGFANSVLTIRTTVAARPADGVAETVFMDTVDFGVTTAGETVYVRNSTESFGDMDFAITDPVDGSTHVFSVHVPENTPVTDLERLITNTINNTVIGDDGLGNEILGSSFIKATFGDITTSGGVASFTITLNWASIGPATVTTEDSGIFTDPLSTTVVLTDDNTVVAGVVSTGISRITWDHVTTSSTLQPGSITTHYATLIYTAT